MTDDQFWKFHGPTWNEFRRSDTFPALLDVLRNRDPARATPALTSTDATECAQHLLGRISGFNLAVNTIEALKQDEPAQEPEVNYTESDDL